VTIIPIIVALAVFVGSTRALPITGDEPHYLIIADSLARDFDLDLRNNYEAEAKNRRIIGPVRPHARDVNGRWMPYHGAGLGLLLAVPWVLAGSAASRVVMCVTAGLIPYAIFRWLRRSMTHRAAAWLAIGNSVSVPILFGSPLIYPDLLCGGLVTVMLVWLLQQVDEDDRSPIGWAAYWLACGVLPWLNIKFVPTTIVLVVGGAVAAWHERSRSGGIRNPAWISAPLAALGPLALVAFNWIEFGSLLGAREMTELTTSGFRALLIFLGLHFDQSQGMFLQQPLLLLGVAMVVPFVWSRPWTAVFWLAAYLSLIVPNAFELARFGTAGPDGRFGWSASWLWMIPLAYSSAPLRRWIEASVAPLVTVGLAYQAALASRWVPTPQFLFPRLEEQLALRDSLFPLWLRAVVPSYYWWDFRTYLTYAPNVVATAATALLIVAGAILWRRSLAAASHS
jgi:hypothetical protein